jgi:hypothetical protein
VVSYTEGPYAGREILFGFSEERGVDIVDVTDKSNMFLLSRTAYPGVRYCHQGWTTPDRRYLYVNDELDEGVTATTTRTLIFDIQDLMSPQLVGTFTTGLPSRDHNLYVHACLLYQANYSTGLRVISIANPEAPVEVGFFDTYPENDAVNFDGAWSVYPYFESGTVILSDIDRGLFVFDVNEARDLANTMGGLLIDYPEGRPTLLDPEQPDPLAVTLKGNCGGSLLEGSAMLHIDTGAGFESTPLTSLGDDRFEGSFPASDCRGTVRYYVSAQTNDGMTVVSPSRAPSEPFEAFVATELTTLVTDDFEQGHDWTTGPDTAATGAWVVGDPEGTAAQPEDDHTPGAGTKCFFTGANPGGGLGTDDVDGGSVVLTSPTFDAACGDAVVTYWRWYFERDVGDDVEDGFVAEISNDGGANWTTIETLSPGSGGWQQVTFRVGALLNPSATMQLRFTVTDGPQQGDIIEAAIDDVTIARMDCPCVVSCPADTASACPAADVDCSGTVNGLDVAVITNSCNFGRARCLSQNVRADVDGSGTVNGLDVAMATSSACFGL